MEFQPLHDRVLVRRVDEDSYQGVIVIPDAAKEKPSQGEVVAVGDGHAQEDGTFRALNVKVGQRVVFGKYSGTEIKIDGETLLAMREEEILGILRPAAKTAKG